MAYTKKLYRSGQPRKPKDGMRGRAVDSSFGAPGNLHKSKKQYKRRDS